jgi:glycosyltransferase involved in cell wall biosynthesis
MAYDDGQLSLFERFVRLLRSLLPSGAYAVTRTCWRHLVAGIRTVIKHVFPGMLYRRHARSLFGKRRAPRENARARAEVEGVIAEHPRRAGILIVLPGIEWNMPLFQRPHQMARAFARSGYLVFFCTPNHTTDKIRHVTRVGQNLYLCPNLYSVTAIPNLVLYAYWASMRRTISQFSGPYQLIYDYLDDLEIFDSAAKALREDHAWLVEHAAVMSVTADRLLAQVRDRRPDAVLCPNAVDYAFFHPAALPPPPEDLRPLLDRPIIGYYGALAQWFDYDLLRAAAAALPEAHFVLIGLDYDASLQKYDWAAYPNVHFFGTRPYRTLPAYAAHFTVATIPFKVNAVTLSTSPVKLFEYLAAGCPVVSTALPECRKYRSVYFAENADDFIRGLRQALAGAYDPALIDAEARANDWQHRAQALLDGLQQPRREERED